MDSTQVKCNSCDRQVSSFFCHDCRIAVPIPRGVDYFRYLGLPQRPKVNLAQLEETYLRLSQDYHPDRHPDLPDDEKEAILARSALLNQAYACLRDPKSRVQYLVELLTQGERSRNNRIPPQIADLFRKVQSSLMEADAFLREAERPKSAMEAAAFALRPDGVENHRGALRSFQNDIRLQQEQALADLAEIDALWDQAGDASEKAFHRLTELSDALAYLDRLEAQVYERLVSLNMLR